MATAVATHTSMFELSESRSLADVLRSILRHTPLYLVLAEGGLLASSVSNCTAHART